MSTPAESPHPELVTPTLLRNWPLPGGGSSKEDRGSVLVIGGARKTPGAALLAGLAALRAGAGRLSLGVAESAAIQLAIALPESGVVGLAETAAGSVRGDGVGALAGTLQKAAAVLVGPGLDNEEEATRLLRELLRLEAEVNGPDEDDGAASDGGDTSPPTMVLDAYALGCLPPMVDELFPWAGRLILTPNTKEAGILLGRDVKDLTSDVAEIAAKFQAVVTCQGVIAAPDGRLWEITTGYGGLGTSGSGDVLAGAIAGLKARGTTPAQAACWGTHLHAAAGDRLASRLGSLGYLARELADELPPLMMELDT
ncbi:NAD(P)H-hydrate dehydratase [Arthrobacter rhizosphaerae]|uniref:NAD(P)H-hydrate dehydratase n=1 Tax=Arthrobacter rhizosphaerae TaxID=2855490 RepID=UPI001FF3DC75|nr:NAD(P)H-hydrate dehydratase [Arthrobacter rhizosphaerae]